MNAGTRRRASVRLVPYLGEERCTDLGCVLVAEVAVIDIQNAPIFLHCIPHWLVLRQQEPGVRLLVEISGAAVRHIATRQDRPVRLSVIGAHR